MPIYTFKDINTNEEYDLEMKIAELDDYLKKNPNVIQILNKINLGDPVKLGVTKNPRHTEFQKYVLPKIHAGAGKQSKIGRGRWDLKREV